MNYYVEPPKKNGWKYALAAAIGAAASTIFENSELGQTIANIIISIF